MPFYRIFGFSDFPKIRKIGISENPDFRISRNSGIPNSEKSDFRKSENPDFQISGLPDFRKSGFSDFRKIDIFPPENPKNQHFPKIKKSQNLEIRRGRRQWAKPL